MAWSDVRATGAEAHVAEREIRTSATRTISFCKWSSERSSRACSLRRYCTFGRTSAFCLRATPDWAPNFESLDILEHLVSDCRIVNFDSAPSVSNDQLPEL